MANITLDFYRSNKVVYIVLAKHILKTAGSPL